MLQTIFKIIENKQIADSVFEMKLEGNIDGIKAGRFVNLRLDGLFLRRPISVCDAENGILTLVYKVVGKGTQKMSELSENETIDILTRLGNGYNETKSGQKPLLIGGGVGVPPMYKLAKDLVARGKDVTVVLGFNKKSEIFYKEKFERLGAKVIVVTADGSVGVKGFVTDAMKDVEYTYFYTCGPFPMLKAVYFATKTSGQFSFEERMGCGFGACMGCSCKTNFGNKRICKDGPVFEKEEILDFTE